MNIRKMTIQNMIRKIGLPYLLHCKRNRTTLDNIQYNWPFVLGIHRLLMISAHTWCSNMYMSQRHIYTIITVCMHYSDVIIGEMASRITSLTIAISTVHLGANQRKHQRSASLAFVRGTHRWPENSSQKWPVTRKMFPYDGFTRTILYR